MKKKIILFFLTFLLSLGVSSVSLARTDTSEWNDTRNMEDIGLDKQREANDDWNAHADKIRKDSEKLTTLDAQSLADIMADLEHARETNDIEKMDQSIAKIKRNSKTAVKILDYQYNLTEMYRGLMNIIRYVGVKLTKISIYLLGWLTLLEGLHMLMDSPTEFPIGKIMQLLVKYGLLLFLTRFWFHLMSILKSDIRSIASMAASLKSGTIDLAPQNVFDRLSYPLTQSWTLLGWTDVVWAFILIVGLILCLLITAEVFMAELEYYLLCGFAIILIPFLAWKQTQGIGTKIGAVLSSQAARLLMLYFFLLTAFKLLGSNNYPFFLFGKEGMVLCIKYSVVLYVLYVLCSKSQALAGNLMSGGAGAVGGRDASNAVTGALAKGVMATAGAIGIVAGAMKIGRSEGAATVAGGVKSAMSKTMSGAAKLYSSAKSAIGKGGSGGSGGSSGRGGTPYE